MSSVTTEYGRIAGHQANGVHRFLGVPYAAAPTGPLRWRAPRPPAPWDGTRDTTSFAPMAVQAHGPAQLTPVESEDCLYLNIWTTTPDREAHQPVMVWFHGGGFLGGATRDPVIDGANLARLGATVVTVGYRLGAFGFLTDAEAGSNFAVLDWIAALNWVRANIAEFGGDPDNVTVFGQSAGAAAVRTLLHASSARDLYHRAIIQSAGFEDFAVVDTPSYERAAAATRSLRERLGAATVDELRARPAHEVRAAASPLSGTFPQPGEVHTPANLVWHPVSDGLVVETATLDGCVPGLPVLLSCTENEARFFCRPDGVYARPDLRPDDVYTWPTTTAMAHRLGGVAAEELLDHYRSSAYTPYEALTDLMTAAIWHEPEDAALRHFAAAGRPIYSARFAKTTVESRRSGMLAFHTSDIPYVFGNVENPADFDESDRETAAAVTSGWLSFARDGVPRSASGTAWPPYTLEVPTRSLIDEDVTSVPVERSAAVGLLAGARSAR